MRLRRLGFPRVSSMRWPASRKSYTGSSQPTITAVPISAMTMPISRLRLSTWRQSCRVRNTDVSTSAKASQCARSTTPCMRFVRRPYAALKAHSREARGQRYCHVDREGDHQPGPDRPVRRAAHREYDPDGERYLDQDPGVQGLPDDEGKEGVAGYYERHRQDQEHTRPGGDQQRQSPRTLSCPRLACGPHDLRRTR